jgi:hypothetical protein
MMGFFQEVKMSLFGGASDKTGNIDFSHPRLFSTVLHLHLVVKVS